MSFLYPSPPLKMSVKILRIRAGRLVILSDFNTRAVFLQPCLRIGEMKRNFFACAIIYTFKRPSLKMLRIYVKAIKRNLINQILIYHTCFSFAIAFVQKSIQ